MERVDVQYWLLPTDENNLRCQVAGYRNLKDYLITRGLRLNKWKETGLIKELITPSGMKVRFGKCVQYSKIGLTTVKLSSVYPKIKKEVFYCSDSVIKSPRIQQQNVKRPLSGHLNLRQTESFTEEASVLLGRPQSARPPSKEKPKVYPLQRAKTIFLNSLDTKSIVAVSKKSSVNNHDSPNHGKLNTPLYQRNKPVIQKSTPNNLLTKSILNFKRHLQNGKSIKTNNKDSVKMDTAIDNDTKITAVSSKENKNCNSGQKNIENMPINLTSCEKSEERNGDSLSSTNFKQVTKIKSESIYNNQDIQLEHHSPEINNSLSFVNGKTKEENSYLNAQKNICNQPEEMKQNENVNDLSYSRSRLTITEEYIDNENVNEDIPSLENNIFYEDDISEPQPFSPRDHELETEVNKINQDSDSTVSQNLSEIYNNVTENVQRSLHSTKIQIFSEEEKLGIDELNQNICLPKSENSFPVQKQEAQEVKKDLNLLSRKISLEQIGVKVSDHQNSRQDVEYRDINPRICSSKNSIAFRGMKKEIQTSNKDACSPKDQDTPLEQRVENEEICQNVSLSDDQNSFEQNTEFRFIDEDDNCQTDKIPAEIQKINIGNLYSFSSKLTVSQMNYEVESRSVSRKICSTNQVEFHEHKTHNEKVNKDIYPENNKNYLEDREMGLRISNKDLCSSRDQNDPLQQKTNNIKDTDPVKNQTFSLEQNTDLKQGETVEAKTDPKPELKVDIENVIQNLEHLNNQISFQEQEQTKTANQDLCFSRNCTSNQNKEESEDKNILVDYQVAVTIDFNSSRNHISILEQKDAKAVNKNLCSLWNFIQESEIKDLCPIKNELSSSKHSVKVKETKSQPLPENEPNEKILESNTISQKNYISNSKHKSKSKQNDDLYLLKNNEHKSGDMKCSLPSLFMSTRISQNSSSEEIVESERTIKGGKDNKDSYFITNSTQLEEEKEVNSSNIIDLFTPNYVNHNKTDVNGFIQIQSKPSNCANRQDLNSSLDVEMNEEFVMTEMLKKGFKTTVKKSSSFTSAQSQLFFNSSSSSHSIKSTTSSDYMTGSDSSFSLD